MCTSFQQASLRSPQCTQSESSRVDNTSRCASGPFARNSALASSVACHARYAFEELGCNERISTDECKLRTMKRKTLPRYDLRAEPRLLARASQTAPSVQLRPPPPIHSDLARQPQVVPLRERTCQRDRRSLKDTHSGPAGRGEGDPSRPQFSKVRCTHHRMRLRRFVNSRTIRQT